MNKQVAYCTVKVTRRLKNTHLPLVALLRSVFNSWCILNFLCNLHDKLYINYKSLLNRYITVELESSGGLSLICISSSSLMKLQLFVVSSGLKKFLVPILVGLLESEKRRQWTFDNFFCASKDITCRTVVHIFSVSDCSQNRLYLGKEERKRLVAH